MVILRNSTIWCFGPSFGWVLYWVLLAVFSCLNGWRRNLTRNTGCNMSVSAAILFSQSHYIFCGYFDPINIIATWLKQTFFGVTWPMVWRKQQQCECAPTRILEARMLRPAPPSTWRVVFKASTGMRTMRKAAAAPDAPRVFTLIGRLAVDS